MKRFSILILFSIILISCDTSNDDDIDSNRFAEYIVHENASLKFSEDFLGTFVEVVDGDQLVFEYNFSEASNPEIADSGYDHYLYFEMAANTGDFKLTSNDFAASNTFVRQSCFCLITDFRRVTSGEISAQKIDDLEWDITFNVTAANIENEEGEVIPEKIDIAGSGIFKPE